MRIRHLITGIAGSAAFVLGGSVAADLPIDTASESQGMTAQEARTLVSESLAAGVSLKSDGGTRKGSRETSSMD
jgi:hypothetical protein